MYNIKTSIDKDVLTITVDLKAATRISGSGKSEVIASTEGNIVVAGDIKAGINIYRPRG